MSPRLKQFDAEIKTITQRRGAVYAHPSVDFDRARRIKDVVAECKDPIVRHVLEMLAVKMARLINSPAHVDSWVDIAGYARCGVMVTDKDPYTGGCRNDQFPPVSTFKLNHTVEAECTPIRHNCFDGAVIGPASDRAVIGPASDRAVIGPASDRVVDTRPCDTEPTGPPWAPWATLTPKPA